MGFRFRSLVGKQLRNRAPRAVAPRAAVATAAAARPMWLPGSPAPEYLDGSLPGDYGFDPLGLGADKEWLSWFQQAELMHCRWAMIGAAGILLPDMASAVRPAAPPLHSSMSVSTTSQLRPPRLCTQHGIPPLLCVED
jgi:hypothetical protein